MSLESGPKSPVPLVTAAYLAQASGSAEPASSEPAPVRQSGLTSLQIANRIIGAVVVGALIPVSMSLMADVAKERERRKCGADWMLWVAGSDETFQDKINASLEESRLKFEREMKDSMKPLEIKEFDLNAAFGQSPAFGGQYGNP